MDTILSVDYKFKLRLEIPSKHDTYFQPGKMPAEGGYSRPISGSVVCMHGSNPEEDIVELSQLKIRLVRVVTTTTEQPVVDHEPIIGRLSRWITSKRNCQQTCSKSTIQNCSVVEELTMHVTHLSADDQVGYSPEEGRIYKIPFHLPVPTNLPPTSKTDLGEISYLIVASAKAASGESPATSQQISLCRQSIPEPDTARYTRVYPGSKIVTKIIMTQTFGHISKSNIRLSAEVFVRQPVKPADRPNEYKCVAVRGVQWRIEEVSRTFYRPEDETDLECPPIEDRKFVKEIAKGFQKGYWKPLQSLNSTEEPSHCDDFSVEIPLEMEIPNIEMLAPAIEMSCYDAVYRLVDSLSPAPRQSLTTTAPHQMMLTIEHRLKLDILTTENTFDVCQHHLVDRNPLRTALNASFPLQVINRTEGNVEELLSESNPPRYEEVSFSPPGYDRGE